MTIRPTVHSTVPSFTFEAHEVRVIVGDGAPRWVAADVARVLGYSSASAATRLLREHQKGTHSVHTPGGVQRMAVVTESGLYRLILRSNLPDAERFQDWVTDEVLPAIRETNSYTVSEPAPAIQPRGSVTFDLEDPLQQAHLLVQAVGLIQRLQADAVRAAETIATLEPKAAIADKHQAAEGQKALRDFANEVTAWARQHHGASLTQREVLDFLAEIGMLIRGDSIRNNRPTKMAGDRRLVQVRVGLRESHSSASGLAQTHTTRITPAGENFAWVRIHKRLKLAGNLRPLVIGTSGLPARPVQQQLVAARSTGSSLAPRS